MIKESNIRISPLLSFDFYLESYHKLLRQFKKEGDLKRMRSLFGTNIDQNIQTAGLQLMNNSSETLLLPEGGNFNLVIIGGKV